MSRLPALSAAILLAACTGSATAEPAPYVLQGGHIDLDRGPDGNTVILDAPQGLVVVDSGRHPAHAERIIAHARKIGRPIAALVNTHWHLDHTTGNRDILAAYPEARVVASKAVEGALDGFLARSVQNARQRLADPNLAPAERQRTQRALAAMDDRAALIPSQAIVKDGRIELGGRRIEARLAPRAATEGDVWLILPDEGLAVVGDLVVGPFPFFDTGCEEGWAKALAAIADAKWTRLIPGHGAPMDRTQFARWRRAFTALIACARSDAKSDDCAAGWQRNAAGFFTEAERPEVRELAVYYVDEVLRAPPERRMAYCRN